MSWSKADQEAATILFAEYLAEYEATLAGWKNGIQAGSPAQGQAAVEDVLRRWRQSIEDTRHKSDMLMANDGQMERLNQLVTSLEDERKVLERLRGEAVTRGDQADTVNPKSRPSPYTNLLGLQRTFRESTRMAILIASIIFGVLALVALGYLVYKIVVTGEISPVGYLTQAGGHRRH
jgi:hypothetical protein